MGNGKQQVLGGDVFILEVVRFFEGTIQNLVQDIGNIRLRRTSRHLGQLFDLAVHLVQHGLRPHADLLENRRHDALAVLEQRRQQMDRHQFGIAVFRRQIAGALYCLLSFDCKLVPTNGHGILLNSTLMMALSSLQQLAISN